MALAKIEKATTNVTLYLAPSVVDRLDALAARFEIPRAAVLREVIAQGLADVEANTDEKVEP